MADVRTINVGDIHGCLDELQRLVHLCDVRVDDRVVILGDMIDRGPDPIGVVHFVRDHRWEAVLGNHEEKAVRWRRREVEQDKTGRANPMRPPGSTRREQWNALTDEDIRWMSRLPFTLDLGNGWIAVHAGFEDVPMNVQRSDKLLRTRYLDSFGEFLSLGKIDPPPNSRLWAEVWRGPQSVVYGHHVHSFGDPRVDVKPNGVRCVGLDTGCVYGGRLSAMILEADGTISFRSVKASKEYHQSKFNAHTSVAE